MPTNPNKAGWLPLSPSSEKTAGPAKAQGAHQLAAPFSEVGGHHLEVDPHDGVLLVDRA
jgi:hypothetical protein